MFRSSKQFEFQGLDRQSRTGRRSGAVGFPPASGEPAAMRSLIRVTIVLLLLTWGAQAQDAAMKALEEQRYPEALQLYEARLVTSPDDVQALEGKSKALMGLKRLPPALEAIEKALRLAPDNAEVLAQRGSVLSRLGRPKEALIDFDRALVNAPNTAHIHVSRGYVLAELGRFKEASEAHTIGLRLNPEATLAYAGRAYARAQLGEVLEAFTDVKEALQRQPNLVPAIHTYADLLFRRTFYEKALEQYNRAIDLEPTNAFLWGGRGGVHAALDHLDSALSDYNRAIELDPERSPVYSARGNLLAGMGRLEEAVRDHDQAVAVGKGSPDPLVQRGQFYLDWMEMPAKALNDFDKAVELAPNMAEAYLGRGEAYLEIEQPARALVDLNKAIELAPILYAYTSRARAYYDLGQVERAEKEYRDVLAGTPTFAPAHLGLGYLQMERGQLKEAKASFDATFKHAAEPDLVLEAQRALAALLHVGDVSECEKVDVDLEYSIRDDEYLMSEELSSGPLLDLYVEDLPAFPIDPDNAE